MNEAPNRSLSLRSFGLKFSERYTVWPSRIELDAAGARIRDSLNTGTSETGCV